MDLIEKCKQVSLFFWMLIKVFERVQLLAEAFLLLLKLQCKGIELLFDELFSLFYEIQLKRVNDLLIGLVFISKFDDVACKSLLLDVSS